MADDDDGTELDARLRQAQAHTDDMVHILTGFEERLVWLEGHMLPLHNITADLTAAQANLDQTLAELELNRENLEVVAREGSPVQHGLPSGFGVSALAPFTSSVAKLVTARRHLREPPELKSKRRALAEIDRLIDHAMVQCEEEFGRLVGDGVCRGTGNPSKRNAIATSEHSDVVDQLTSCMLHAGYVDFLRMYAVRRGHALERELSNHPSFARTRLGVVGLSSMHGGGGGGGGGGDVRSGVAPPAAGSGSGEDMRGVRRSNAGIENGASALAAVSTGTGPGAGTGADATTGGVVKGAHGNTSGVSRGMNSVEATPRGKLLSMKIPYVRGSHPFIPLLRSFIGVLQSESDKAAQVLRGSSTGDWHSCFLQAIEPLIDLICSAGSEALIGLQQKTKAADPDTLIAALDLAQTGREVLPMCKRLLQQPQVGRPRLGSSSETVSGQIAGSPASKQSQSHLDGLQELLAGAAHSSLVGYHEAVLRAARGSGGLGLSLGSGSSSGSEQATQDATVHSLTSRTMHLLRRMMEFQPTVDWLLGTNQQLPAMCTRDYARSILRDHVQGLQARAADKPAKDKARAAVPHLFLLNNLHYISSTIRSGFQEEQEMQNAEVSGTEQHGLQGGENAASRSALRQQVGDDLIQVWEHLCEVNKETYFEKSWDRLVSSETGFVEAVAAEQLQTQRGSKLLTLESGRLLKVKFDGFNTLFEQLHKVFRHCSVPDPILRAQLISDTIARVVPPFRAFYEKYRNVQFSKKNMSKYLRYSPEVVDSMLQELFGGVSSKT